MTVEEAGEAQHKLSHCIYAGKQRRDSRNSLRFAAHNGATASFGADAGERREAKRLVMN